jgi:hypothetical protein
VDYLHRLGETGCSEVLRYIRDANLFSDNAAAGLL